MEVARVHIPSNPKTVAEPRQQTLANKLTRESQHSGEERQGKEKLQEEISGLNKWLEIRGTHIKFTLHEELNEYYVQVVNDETNEVIREIPPKKILDISAKLQEMIGLLVDEKR